MFDPGTDDHSSQLVTAGSCAALAELTLPPAAPTPAAWRLSSEGGRASGVGEVEGRKLVMAMWLEGGGGGAGVWTAVVGDGGEVEVMSCERTRAGRRKNSDDGGRCMVG